MKSLCYVQQCVQRNNPVEFCIWSRKDPALPELPSQSERVVLTPSTEIILCRHLTSPSPLPPPTFPSRPMATRNCANLIGWQTTTWVRTPSHHPPPKTQYSYPGQNKQESNWKNKKYMKWRNYTNRLRWKVPTFLAYLFFRILITGLYNAQWYV